MIAPRRAIAPDDERSLRSERNHKAENKVMELADETAGVWYVANYEFCHVAALWILRILQPPL